MNRTAMCIQMLQYLNANKIISVAELAERLETNPRNIPEFKKELEIAGYYIDSKSGKYGGYSLDANHVLPSVNFTEEEKEAMVNALGYLKAREDFFQKQEFEVAIAKVMTSIKSNVDVQEVVVMDSNPLAMSKFAIEERCRVMRECIKSKISIDIQYQSAKNKLIAHKVNPYEIFMHNNAWFVLGFDDIMQIITYFKINKIVEYKKTDKKFSILPSYSKKEYIDGFGFKQLGNYIPIKVKMSGIQAGLVKEKIHGRNQIIEECEDGTTILSCEIQFESNVIQFILKYGTYCEVLEPLWVKDKVAVIVGKMYKQYCGDEMRDRTENNH